MSVVRSTLLLLVFVLVALASHCADKGIVVTETILDSPLWDDPTWVGKDDSTILAITEAGSLWRSINYGKDWNKVELKADEYINEIILSDDKLKLVVVGDGGGFWYSRDNARTFNKSKTAPGLMEDIQFHPLHNEWLLASYNNCPDTPCSRDLYLSVDLGANWALLRTYVFDYDWHGTVDVDEKMIIVWESPEKSGSQSWSNVAPQVVRSRTLFRTPPEVIAKEAVGFLVLNRHIFIAQAHDAEGLILLSSQDAGESFNEVRFPLNMVENRYTILDVSEGSTFINVEHEGWNWGNVYGSNSMGTDFALSLAYNARDYWGEVEFGRVQGIEGIYMANQYSEISSDYNSGDYPQTLISFDKGGSWRRLAVPSDYQCPPTSVVDECRLNLDFDTVETRREAIGLVVGSGNPGAALTEDWLEMYPYISRDAGWTWKKMSQLKGDYHIEIGNRGGLILMAERGELVSKMFYTLNQGGSWSECDFMTPVNGVDSTDELIDIYNIVSDPDISSRRYLLYGAKGSGWDQVGVLYDLDFSGLMEKDCTGFDRAGQSDSDYEFFIPSDLSGNECLLGRKTQYTRRRADSPCWNKEDVAKDFVGKVIKNCPCTEENYECDYCYVRDHEGKCVLDDECGAIFDPASPPYPCNNVWNETKGYRRVPGDSCDASTGVNHLPIVHKCPGSNHPPSSNVTPQPPGSAFSQGMLVAILVILILGLALAGLYLMSGRNETVRGIVSTCVPEKFLPAFEVPGARYGTLSSEFAADDDLKHDAAVLDLGASSDDE